MSKIILPKNIIELLMTQFDIWESEYGNCDQEQLDQLYEENHMLDHLYGENYMLDRGFCSKNFRIDLLLLREEEENDDEEEENDDEGDSYLLFSFSVGGMTYFTLRLTQKERLEKFLFSAEFKFEHEFCPCGRPVFENDMGKDMCEDCFLYDYEHEEDCCICLENGRRWMKLNCGHVLHKHCWIKTKDMRCPLCRTKNETACYAPYGFGAI